VDANPVTVDVAVAGVQSSELHAEDFTLCDNGIAQQISYFTSTCRQELIHFVEIFILFANVVRFLSRVIRTAWSHQLNRAHHFC
jgi:hypothetical protein